MKRRTTEEMIQKSLKEGYTLLEVGYGTQDAVLEHYRAAGYDVRAWYVPSDKEGVKKFEAYGRIKSKRGRQKKVDTVNYEKYTVKELKAFCQKYKVPGYSKMNKQKMIEVLKEVG